MKYLFIRLLANLRNLLYYFKFFCMSLTNKPQKEYILFDSFAGLGFNDNPKAIFDYLIDTKYKLIWVFKDEAMIDEFNSLYPKYKAIKYNSFEHYKYLNLCQTWIFNYKTPPYFIKKDKIKFLQTWHGIPLKKLGCDIVDRQQKFYRSQQSYFKMAESYINEGAKCDYFIAPSSYSKEKFISAFKLNPNKIIESSYPRNKVLSSSRIITIKNTLKLNPNKKVILYAPTWRDNSSTLTGYTPSYLLDFKYFADNLSEEYQLLYRPHYLIKETIDFSLLNDFVTDVSNYQDINDLYNIADLLITDYSSVYFDYSTLNRPIYFYMPDLDDYKNNLRDFYINITSDLPNDYYLDEKKLVQAISTNYVSTAKQANFYNNNNNYPLDMSKIISKLEL